MSFRIKSSLFLDAREDIVISNTFEVARAQVEQLADGYTLVECVPDNFDNVKIWFLRKCTYNHGASYECAVAAVCPGDHLVKFVDGGIVKLIAPTWHRFFEYVSDAPAANNENGTPGNAKSKKIDYDKVMGIIRKFASNKIFVSKHIGISVRALNLSFSTCDDLQTILKYLYNITNVKVIKEDNELHVTISDVFYRNGIKSTLSLEGKWGDYFVDDGSTLKFIDSKAFCERYRVVE